MIPEKLYLPTTTLNFNNIMSSESISPASFYLKRGFGYNRFVKVDPNPLDNRIILYGDFPVFKILDNELENYPLVIEIDSRYINEDLIKEINGIYYTEETIYLNPFTTKFIFRNDQERISTISKAEPAIESKMVLLYTNCFITIDEYNITNKFDWNNIGLEDSKHDNSQFISKDRRINKLKGLLYAYLIASNKSMSPDIVLLKKLARNLKNTLSAIIKSPDGRATYAQDEQLNTLYKSINDKLKDKFISPIIEEKSKKYQCDFNYILVQENLWEEWLRANNLSKFQITPFNVFSNKEQDVAFDNYIQSIDNLLNEVEKKQKKQIIDVTNLPILQNYRIIRIPVQEELLGDLKGILDPEEFLSKLFNEYLIEAYNSEEFIQSRYEFAKTGGKIFKDELQDKWNGSQWQQYINGLLKNLNEYSAFDLKSINNITLESFAAFCQKGESDIDKLEDYLIMNEIGDFRIAFSLWGIIFGFANIPKTLTNELFQLNDPEYVTRIYKHIFKQLHSIELDGNWKKIEIKEQSEKFKSEKPNQIFVKNEEKSNLITTNNYDIKIKLKDCKLKPEQIDSIIEIYEKNNFIINEKFFASIRKIKGIGVKTIEKIQLALNYSETHNEKDQQLKINLINQDVKPELGKEFYLDSNIWYYIEPIIDEKFKEKVKEEIEWIQKVHREKGYYKYKSGEWISLTDHSNASVIKHFENNAKNRMDSELLKKIVSKLKELYK